MPFAIIVATSFATTTATFAIITAASATNA